MVGLTNDNPEMTAPVYKRYHHVEYDGIWLATTTASVTFPPSTDTFRYVIIQQQFPDNTAICLSEVKVFLRGILAYFVTQIIIKPTSLNDSITFSLRLPLKHSPKLCAL